jgi:hypothetical protein
MAGTTKTQSFTSVTVKLLTDGNWGILCEFHDKGPSGYNNTNCSADFYPSLQAFQNHAIAGLNPLELKVREVVFTSWADGVRWLQSNWYRLEGRAAIERH